MPANFRNPSYQDLLQGFSDRMAALGQPFELIRTGETFRAIAINVPPIDPRLELGSDWRECCTIEARRDQIPQSLRDPSANTGDLLKQLQPPFNTSQFQEFPIWKTIRREDNGANFTIKFWLVKVPANEQDSALASVAASA